MPAGQHDRSMPSVSCQNELDRYDDQEHIKRLSSDHEILVKKLFMMCVHITLVGFQRFLLSQKISPLFSSEERMLVPDAKDFASLWELCKSKFKWENIALLRHLLHYVPKRNCDKVCEMIDEIEKNKTRYLSSQVVDGLPTSMMKLALQHDYITESEVENHRPPETNPAIHKRNPGPDINQQVPDQECFIEEAEQESTVMNDQGELVTGRYHLKIDLCSGTDMTPNNESALSSERNKTLQSTVALFLSKYPSPPTPQSLVHVTRV